MSRIATCLWFDGKAEEAARFHVGAFQACGRAAAIDEIMPGPGGQAMAVNFTLDGQSFIGLNGGPHFTFTPAISLFVSCADQAEVDAFWSHLGEGGTPGQCGWLTDRFGLSWQVVPKILGERLRDPDREAAGRVMQAMLQMTKLDVARLEAAYRGG